MKIQSLGHVVLKAADLDRAEAFYTGVLGMEVCARFDDNGMKMIFFSLGNHHDLAVMEAPATDGAAENSGLHHVAFKIGDDMSQLREAKSHLEARGLELMPIDHDVTKSLYFSDPDGNMVEVYVDVSDGWKTEPARIARAEPMEM